MSLTTVSYLFFSAVNLFLIWQLAQQWRRFITFVRKSVASWMYLLVIATAITLVVSSAVWIFMAVYTASSWIAELNPSVPKPYFLIVWFISAMVLSASFSFGNLLLLWMGNGSGTGHDADSAGAP